MIIIYGGKLIIDNMSYYLPTAKTGLAVWVESGTVTIEGSDDNFITTPFTQDFTVDSYIAITETFTNWRMTGKGKFYIGTLITVDDPDHPYAFAKRVESADKFTLGGTPHSKIYNSRRVGTFNWKGVKEAVLPLFENWFDGSNNYRDVFVAEDRLKSVAIPCTSVDDFPFTLDVHDIYSGELELVETL